MNWNTIGQKKTGDWYDVVYNKYDDDETFSIIDNQGHINLYCMYGEENDDNHKLPRTYAKWFYTPKELEKKLKRQNLNENISSS